MYLAKSHWMGQQQQQGAMLTGVVYAIAAAQLMKMIYVSAQLMKMIYESSAQREMLTLERTSNFGGKWKEIGSQTINWFWSSDKRLLQRR